jgi:hypothetical protein
MFDFFHSIRLWLEANGGVAAPWVVLTILIFGAVNGIKRFAPGLWTWFDKITPTGGLLEHVVMGLPSVALGAISTWLLTGGELAEIWKGAMAAALAPVLHLWAKSYQGAPAEKKTTPPGAGTAALVLAVFLVGCTAAQVAKTIDTAVDVAQDVEKIAKVLCLLDQAKVRGARPDLVQDGCDTVQKLGPWIPAARAMAANPRAMLVNR